MSEYNIFRQASDAEKSDFIELGRKNILTKFLAKLSEKRAEYQKKYKPYDGYSARIDFEELVRRTVVETEANLNKDNVKSIELPDLDIYGNADRFELVKIDDVVEDKLLDGIRQAVKTGKQYNYRAKQRGNGISIFVPGADVHIIEERLQQSKQKEEKKA